MPSLTYLNTAQGITQQGTMAVPQHCTISSLKTILDSLKFLIVSFSQLWVRTISTTLHKDYSSSFLPSFLFPPSLPLFLFLSFCGGSFCVLFIFIVFLPVQILITPIIIFTNCYSGLPTFLVKYELYPLLTSAYYFPLKNYQYLTLLLVNN